MEPRIRAWSGSGGLAGTVLIGGALLTIIATLAFIAVCAGLDDGSLSPAAGVPLLILAVLVILLCALGLSMLRIINPGHTLVVQFFGRYLGTNRSTGLTLVPPLSTTKKASVRVRNFETSEIKVNDLNGNPVMIGAIVVWQVADTAKATFAVEDVEEFIHSQAESALRHVVTTQPVINTGGLYS